MAGAHSKIAGCGGYSCSRSCIAEDHERSKAHGKTEEWLADELDNDTTGRSFRCTLPAETGTVKQPERTGNRELTTARRK
jgi:hypothetical protein